MNKVTRKPVNVTIPADLLTQASDLGVNISRAAEQGLRDALKVERERIWLERNRDAIASSNAYIEQHGLPLEDYRTFEV